MKRHWVLRGVKFALMAAVFVAVFGLLVMGLWNRITPALFGWHRISYWQALGILILSKILFGGFRGGGGPHWYWRRRVIERWEQMSPEEREKFREGMRSRCHSVGQAHAEPNLETKPKSPAA